MKVGYFKVPPAVPAIVSPRDRTLALPPDRKVAPRHPDKWRLLALPFTGLVLAVVLVGSMQIGVKLANYDLPKARYDAVAQIDLPDNVSFLASVYDSASVFIDEALSWCQDTWDKVVTNWRIFLGLEQAPIVSSAVSLAPTTSPQITIELREQLRQQILSELKAEQASNPEIFGGAIPSDKPVYAVVAVPGSGSPLTDEVLKQNLRQAFADQVDIKFDSNGSAGTITPIFQDGRRGNTYVFVLTPTR